MQGLRESLENSFTAAVEAAVEQHFNAESVNARIQESDLLRLGQAQKSKQLHAKREAYHVKKFNDFETMNNRRFEEAEAKIQSLMGRLEVATKDCETKGEELNDVKNELAETKGALDKTNHDKEALEGELGALKTSHEEERNAYKARIAQLQNSLAFAHGRSERLELGLKMKKALDEEKEDYVGGVTRLQGELKEAEEAKRRHDITFFSESNKIHNAVALVAAATEGQAGNQLDEGGALLISVHNGFGERKMSKGARNRANKKRRREEEEQGLERNNEHNSSILLRDPFGEEEEQGLVTV